MNGTIRFFCIVCLCVVMSGCPNLQSFSGGGPSIGAMTDELNTDLNELPQRPAAVQPKLADLAHRAREAAPAAADPQSRVAYYRIAAIAAWKAGDASKAEVLDISNAGATACEGLPPAQQRPTDCAIIALATSFAVYEAGERQLGGFQKTHADLQSAAEARCRALPPAASGPCLLQPTLLPRADGDSIKRIFSEMSHQFDDLTKIRNSMESQTAIDQSLKDATDDARTTVFCGVETAWSTFQDAEGSQGNALDPLTNRKNEMQCRLSFSAAQCAQENHPQPKTVDCEQFANKPRALPAVH
jgi:hypothetical protein